MKIKLIDLGEPKLEFAQAKTESHVRDALVAKLGPYGSNFHEGVKDIKLGLVSIESECKKIVLWIESLAQPAVSEEENWKRFPEYHGSIDALRCRFSVSSEHIRNLDEGQIARLLMQGGREGFNSLLNMYAESVESLFSDSGPACVVVFFPEEIASLRIANPKLTAEERMVLEGIKEEDEFEQLELFEVGPDQKKMKEIAQDLLPQADELLYRNFYRALKARCMNMHNSVPLQVIREHTYRPDDSSQSSSTIAWNTTLAMYYKAGNIPWRLSDIASDTCFVGISFHYLKKRDGDLMYASVAHAFSSSGEGFAIKGSNIPKDQVVHKRPYLRSEQASELVDRVLNHYQQVNGVLPSRVVVHKTSRFEQDEKDGFRNSILAKVPTHELAWLIPSGFRLLRRGVYPPNRGMLALFPDNQAFLFTTGFVSRWGEYPGPHIPSPLQIGTSSPERIEETCREILALTKMNWNSTDGMGRNPITISFARRVGITMTELEEDDKPNPSYRFYM